jgi:hypothetical protein
MLYILIFFKNYVIRGLNLVLEFVKIRTFFSKFKAVSVQKLSAAVPNFHYKLYLCRSTQPLGSQG